MPSASDIKDFLKWASAHGHERKTVDVNLSYYYDIFGHEPAFFKDCIDVYNDNLSFTSEDDIEEWAEKTKKDMIESFKKIRAKAEDGNVELLKVNVETDYNGDLESHVVIRRPETDEMFYERMNPKYMQYVNSQNRLKNLEKKIAEKKKALNNVDKLAQEIADLTDELNQLKGILK
uniref:Uncharacterized protein n=1 Tax=Rhizobium phage LG08 TaxID=3129229 RepID=A0AAU8HYR4_9CAUD